MRDVHNIQKANPKVQKAETKQIDIGKEIVMPKPKEKAPNPSNKFKCCYHNCNETFEHFTGLSSHFKSVHEGFSK